MRTLFMLCATVFFSAAAFAQPASVTVGNNTGCSVRVYLYASGSTVCATDCSVGPFCVMPGNTISVAPCGPSTWRWTFARVIPTSDDCSTPCSSGFVAVSPPFGCLSSVASSTHCHCGPYTADFSGGPSILKIY